MSGSVCTLGAKSELCNHGDCLSRAVCVCHLMCFNILLLHGRRGLQSESAMDWLPPWRDDIHRKGTGDIRDVRGSDEYPVDDQCQYSLFLEHCGAYNEIEAYASQAGG